MSTPETKAKAGSSWINLLVDYGPLLVFFLAYRHFSPKGGGDAGLGAAVAVTKSTVTFMIATVIALVVSKWRLGRISPMLWLSSTLIMGFGALTVFLGDPTWIQIKPTVVYVLFAGILFAGLARGRPMLRDLLQSAFDGLDEKGWLKLSRNWAWFFLVLAVLNEVLRHLYNKDNGGFETWLTIKVWGVSALSFLFTFAQIPMLLRHGLGEKATENAETTTPHD
ncbi:intracellular septation protein A [Novosphingobium nitrogenifigens DSM 19370]|uniref:Inner membrane-spanning protein YciB n=1 Tax=Novosphingobium nitrogenifigens DSM 19370 TaxID=983920 RepID=F1ZCJ2_9SPHN|nr:inner membrane-spanning protein YciB [Novosphingobium nitrogenifigens]EGD57726.1 intracellular septation protein A [Novosphingobium nitrogenifigens DSM 19370]